MYEVDGIVYAGETRPLLKIVSVYALDGFRLRVRFSTGEEKVFDFTPLLDEPVFLPLKDPAVFERVCLDHGVPSWLDGDIDIAPERVFQDGCTINPLQKQAS